MVASPMFILPHLPPPQPLDRPQRHTQPRPGQYERVVPLAQRRLVPPQHLQQPLHLPLAQQRCPRIAFHLGPLHACRRVEGFTL